jgi:hypothetical protein
MAGDWLKVRHDLPTDPAVIAIAATLDLTEDEVVGKLIRFWIWGDQQTRDGNAPGVTKTFLDRYLGVTGFADAMREAGWLDIGNGGISIPNFERHISQSAKQRALTARRKAKCQAKKGNARSVTKAFPREEKRRDSNNPPKAPLDSIKYPAGMDTPAVRQALTDWLDYKQKRREAYKDPARQLTRLLAFFNDTATTETFIKAVDHSIASNYAGCFPPKGNHGKPNQVYRNPSGRPAIKSIET